MLTACLWILYLFLLLLIRFVMNSSANALRPEVPCLRVPTETVSHTPSPDDSFLDKVTRQVDEGHSLNVIYLNFAKAFDKVPRQRLLLKQQNHVINPFIASCSKLLLFERFTAILVKPTFFNFWHTGALALSPERQSARMSKIKNDALDQNGKV